MTDDEKILAAMETLMGLLDDTNVAYAVKHEKGEALYDAVMPKSTGECHWKKGDWKKWREKNRERYNAAQRQWHERSKVDD